MTTLAATVEMSDELLQNQRFNLSDDILYREVDNEAILLNIPDGSYYSLNETSLAFWEAIRDEQPLENAVNQILTAYDVSREQILNDLSGFLESLLSFNLIALRKS
jgi:5,10-methylenetetrahydrofolate reductase